MSFTATLPEKGIYDCPILSVKNLSDEIYLMRLHGPQIARRAVPGQFVNIRVTREYIPLLRKPFSVCRRDADAGWFEILWKIVGKGTAILATLGEGDTVNVLGPLGHGYRIPDDLEKAFLVAGGLGVAPLPFLCEELLRDGRLVQIYLGARTAAELVLLDFFEHLKLPTFLTTEDGSLGEQGLVTEVFERHVLKLTGKEPCGVFCCGPNGLLKRIAELSKQYRIAAQVSIETMMGCGFGICMGCPVQLRRPSDAAPAYKLTCVDGPVFQSQEIVLDG